MEVLTAVDRDQIEILRARDEFFWLDLKVPFRRRPQHGGRAARAARARARGHP